MPRYLRWLAAISTGLMSQFVFQFAVLGILSGSGHKQVNGAAGAFLAFSVTIINVVITLAVNDWLAGKYPLPAKTRPAERASKP